MWRAVGVRAITWCGAEDDQAGREHTGLASRRNVGVQSWGGPDPVGLEQVVIDVLHADLGAGPVERDRFQLLHHQRPGGVLGERLIHPQRDLLAGHPVDTVARDMRDEKLLDAEQALGYGLIDTTVRSLRPG